MTKLPTAGALREIYLIQPPIGGGKADVTPPLGLLLLGAVLEAEGRTPHVVDVNLKSKLEPFDAARSLRRQLVAGIPTEPGSVHAVGVTTWSYNFDVTMELVEELRKKHKTVPIILGGPHVTFVSEEVLAAFPKAVDYIIRDEGEVTFPMLLRALEGGGSPDALAAIPGLTWRRDGEVVRNPSGPVNEALDDLPYPAYHLVDADAYLACSPVLVVEAGRGCPYNCNFCSTTNMFQRRYRVKSAPRLVDEIEWLIEATGTNRFELLHDNLVANKKYVKELCAEIRRRNLDLAWSCTSRTDNITEAIAEDMFLAGCDQVFFGVESLDPARQRWTGKGLKPAKVHAAIELTARQHIRPSVGIIVGFPEETEAELDGIVRGALRWKTDPAIKAEISTGLLRYYPGADLFAHKDELRHDPLAAADTTAVPGYTTRKAWRHLPELFPVQSIHTNAAQTRANMLRTKFLRSIFPACPLTARACLEWGGFRAPELLDLMDGGRPFAFLRDRSPDLVINETLKALGSVIRAQRGDDSDLLQLLNWEAPFWETAAVVSTLDELEHVIHPAPRVQADLVERTLGQRDAPPANAEGLHIIGVRAGRDVAVWVTADPQAVLRSFEEHLRTLSAQQGFPQRR